MKLRVISSIVIAVGAMVTGFALPAGARAETGPAAAVVRPPAAGFITGSISAGSYHTCGIKTNGTALCWGYDASGQLDGSPSNSTNLGSPPGGGSYVQISTGRAHTCGIKTNGSALCWGYDADGEVDGTPNETSPYETTGSPPGGGTFVQISAGYQYTCGIKTNGTALCWGADQYGQVDGSPNADSPYETTGSPPGGGTFTQISGGEQHTCGIKTDGSVLCWGNNQSGQVNGTPNTTSPYETTGSPPGGGSFVQITAGFSHTCGVKTNGTVLCWGNNHSGQVNGTPNTTSPYETTGSPPGGGIFVQITAALGHTCALKTNGAMLCWGDDSYGQLDATPSTSTMSGSPSGLGTITRMATGEAHTCALKTNGTILCWGLNNTGQLGTLVGTSDTGTPPGGGTYAQTGISAGQSHTCRVNPSGSIICTGSDTQGQLDGTPSTTTHSAVVPGVYVQVSAGQSHTCALTSTRITKCWGDGASGLSTPASGVFTQVASGGAHSCGLRPNGNAVCWGDEPLIALGPFLQIAAGTNHSCGIRADSTAICWGDNSNGQAPTYPAGSFAQISGGGLHTCAVQTDSTMACWGSNQYTQSVTASGLFSQVSAGAGQTCALAADATAVCWGKNDSGQAVSPTGTFTQLASGGDHSCGISTAGAFICWGAAAGFSATGAIAYRSLRVSVSNGWTTMTWKGLKNAIGYNVLKHGQLLNARLIRRHHHRYHFRIHRIVRHPKLSLVARLTQ